MRSFPSASVLRRGCRRACVVLALLAAPATLHGQSRGGLEFLGFHPGDHLEVVQARVAELDGSALRCDRSRADRRVQECRATLTDPIRGGEVRLWLSAIDSVSGVLTLAGELDSEHLDRWRGELADRYGAVDARVQGPQWMMQWVRRNQMIRLTWRMRKGDKLASVSLVDGPVLDGWGRERRPGRAANGGE